ncbi:MAG: hypothetical protein K9M98_00975 [Cephaloticoccus sp.]|nr:hypothetical protein [Cephaloticoccus sp.]MCF7759051.1 hypothetical protein [Cephaloticoccus sp.]
MQSYSPGKPHWWQWVTVLSLDAPAVAVSWQWLFAHTTGANLHWFHHLILGSAVWLAYSADRWIEGWLLPPEQIQTQRHLFYQRRRWLTFTVWLIVLCGSLVLALAHLSSMEFRAGLVLLIPVLLYLLSHQLVHRHHPLRVPKELCVALLFVAGISLFSFVQVPIQPQQEGVLLVLFGLLCFADCALISVWENEVDRHHGQTSLALQYPGGHGLVRLLPWLVAAIALVLAWRETDPLRTASLCAAASGCMLGVIDLAHQHCGRQLSRVLADMVLLTPLLAWAANLGGGR